MRSGFIQMCGQLPLGATVDDLSELVADREGEDNFQGMCAPSKGSTAKFEPALLYALRTAIQQYFTGKFGQYYTEVHKLCTERLPQQINKI